MVKIEIDRKRSDPIEFLTEIGQRLKRANLPNYSWNFEKLQQLRKKNDALDVESQNGMAEVFEDEQEKSTPTTEIEHAFRRCTLEVQVLHPFPIQSQPRFNVCVFDVSGGGKIGRAHV